MVQIYRSRLKLKVTPEEESFGSDPPSCPDFLSYQPPLLQEFPVCHPSGCVDFFWNNPIMLTVTCYNTLWLALRSLLRPGQGTHQRPFCLGNLLGISHPKSRLLTKWSQKSPLASHKVPDSTNSRVKTEIKVDSYFSKTMSVPLCLSSTVIIQISLTKV